MKHAILFVAVLATPAQRRHPRRHRPARRGGLPDAKTTLQLSGCGNEDATSGATLTIEIVPGRARTAPTGTYAVTWQRSPGAEMYRDFTVSVRTAHAGRAFKAMPTVNGLTGKARVYWCTSCERFENGVGDLITLPGVYARRD